MNARGTLVTAVGGSAPVLRRIRVVVAAGPDAGKSVTLDDATLLVGTHDDCGLKLGDPRVSRRHCELRAAPDGVRVADLGSKNGVHHDGARLEVAVLSPGASIKLGDTELRFEADDQELPPLLADRFGALVTRAPAMKPVLGLLAAVAPTDTTVLLEGETGTGKEVLARAIHAASARGKRPFVVVDCGAVAPTLVQSELFGHKKGSFTGAGDDREGVFEAAAGGTVFIDEVGELPLELQPALLRVLEARTVRRLGEAHHRPVDVRVVAATHRSLADEVAAGRFRADLYYRLAVVRCAVPPLRERREDLPALVDAILADLADLARRTGAPPRPTPADLAALRAYRFPGNVRELRNVLERALVVGRGQALVLPPLDDAPAAGRRTSGAAGTLRDERDAFEKAYLVELLDACGGNVSEVARRAGVDRNHVHRLLKKHGIHKDAKKGAAS